VSCSRNRAGYDHLEKEQLLWTVANKLKIFWASGTTHLYLIN